MAYIYDLTDTWNAGGTTFNGIKLNVTDSASAVSSKLVTLQTNGTEHFSVTKAGVGYFSGNVGIGTSSPSTKLEVSGSITMTADANGLLTLGRFASSYPWAIVRPDATATGIEFRNNAGDQVLSMVSSTKNVGIGTSSPTQKLEIEGANPTIRVNDTASSYSYGQQVTSSAWRIYDYNAAAERMRITSAGSVGIGTSSPGSKLSVAENTGTSGVETGFSITNTVDSNLFMQVSGTASTDKRVAIYTSTPTAMAFGTNNAERMRITSAGNVGIGTASPANKFVVSNSGANGFEFDPSSGIIQTYNRGTSAYTGMLLYATEQRFFTGASPTEKARITSAGEMLIGTTTANGILSVVGNQISIAGGGGSGSLGLQIKGTALSAIPSAQIQGYVATGDSGMGTAGDLLIAPRTDVACSVRFITGTTPTERMRIDPTGNVGVGVSPSAWGSTYRALEVRTGGIYDTPAGTASGFTFNAYFNGTNWLYKGTGGNAVALRYEQSGAGHQWYTGPNGAGGATVSFTTAMTLDTSGNLLVGTTSTTLNGSGAYISNIGQGVFSTGSGGGFLNFINNANTSIGSISNSANTATLYNTTSDARLKHDIVDAPEASSLIDAIQVRSFKWNADSSEQRYGFIAQELVTVAPEAVSQPADPDAMMGVDYSKLVPMLVKEIQSLRARVAQLEGN